MASRTSLRLAAGAIARRPATATTVTANQARFYAKPATATTQIAAGSKLVLTIETAPASPPSPPSKAPQGRAAPSPKKWHNQNETHPGQSRPPKDETWRYRSEWASKSMKERIEGFAPYMVATYARPDIIFNRAVGSFLYDLDKKQYIDFTAGIAVMSLGHNHADLEHFLLKQSKMLTHCSNLYHNPFTGKLSKRLVITTQKEGGMHDAASVFICNSGSEANEAGIKFARKVGKVLDPSGEKVEIVSFRNAFHGRTMGSLSATHNPKYQEPFAPMVPGFKVGDLNDIEAIPSLVTEKTCSVIVEPIQGEGGVTPATDEFLIALAKRCREVGALLHYDEIQCGLSRTGQFWAHSHLPKEAHPDILTTAKALGNGLPVGATIVNKHVADKIEIGDHGTTFGGNPLVCAVADRAVYHLSRPGLQQGVVNKSKMFTETFERLQTLYPDLVTGWRGKGLILGLQLTEDPSAIVAACRERGLLVITAGVNTLRFVPPLNIPFRVVREGLEILQQAIEATRGKGEAAKDEAAKDEAAKEEAAKEEAVNEEAVKEE